MPDYGARVSDKAIRETERKLRSTYSTAQRELRKKLKSFNDKYKVKDAAKKKQLAEGKISKQDYADWKAGQVFQQKQWKAKVKEAASVMTNSNEQAAKIVNEGRLDVFSENYNFSAFLGEQQLGISFDVYNTQAVARLIQDDPQILPEWKIDEEKDYEWNEKKVNNIVQQGIIQGEGIPEITKRLCADLATQNENKMRMFARTAMTGAQNAGRQKQMEDAADMGIKVEKQWIATLDSRTRDAHRDRDGETVPYNEEFSGGLEYPGDPAGAPADVYNCRCTMITVYPEHAAHHDGGGRRAYSEYEDEDGEHRNGYVTENPNVYEGWSEKAYRRWLERKQEQNKIAQPEPKVEKKLTAEDLDKLDEMSALEKMYEGTDIEARKAARAYGRWAEGEAYGIRAEQQSGEESKESLFIEEAIKKSNVHYTGNIWRGIMADSDTVEKLKQLFSDDAEYMFDNILLDMKGTSSWTKDVSIAESFAKEAYNYGAAKLSGESTPVVFQVSMSENSVAVDIDRFVGLGQSEVIMSKDARFYPGSLKYKDGYLIATLDYYEGE